MFSGCLVELTSSNLPLVMEPRVIFFMNELLLIDTVTYINILKLKFLLQRIICACEDENAPIYNTRITYKYKDI